MCCCFNKKTKADKAKEDRELIEQNSKAIEALIILAKDNEEAITALKELCEKLKYLTPSEDPHIFERDKRIKNKLEDLRIAFIKADGDDSKKVDGLIQDIKLAIADRNAAM